MRRIALSLHLRSVRLSAPCEPHSMTSAGRVDCCTSTEHRSSPVLSARAKSPPEGQYTISTRSRTRFWLLESRGRDRDGRLAASPMEKKTTASSQRIARTMRKQLDASNFENPAPPLCSFWKPARRRSRRARWDGATKNDGVRRGARVRVRAASARPALLAKTPARYARGEA